MRFKNRSIRFQFALWYTVFLVAVLCFFATAVYLLFSHHLYQDIRDVLHVSVQQSSQNLFDADGTFHLHTTHTSLEDATFFPVVRIYDGAGNQLYSCCDVKISFLPEPKNFYRFRESKDGKYLIYEEPFSKNKSKQYVIQAFYFQHEIQELHILWIILLIVVLITGLIGCVIAWYLAYYLLSPFRKLACEASNISAHNLDERLSHSVMEDEVGQLCLTLNNLFGRLCNYFEVLKRFTSNAAHELKTPITVMRGDIEVLLRRRRTSEEYEETLHYTLNQLDRMERLIHGLLLLAQAESKQTQMTMMPLSLSEIVHEVISINKKIFEGQKSLYLKTDIAQNVFIYGNVDWIRQIVQNLVMNAFQYTPANGHISVSLSSNNGYAEMKVENSGPAIPAEHIPYIFERFHRLDKSRKENPQGSGLGLSICKALTEAHQGTIQVSSVPDATIFYVSLPLYSSNSSFLSTTTHT